MVQKLSKIEKINIENFEKFLIELHQNTFFFKKVFLETNFIKLKENPTNEETSTFILQFIPFFDYVMFFYDDKNIIAKLRELGFANNILKWIVSIDAIEKEIKRLMNIDGLLFIPYNFLFASIEHIRIKFKIELLESFGLSIQHNNIETNTIFLDFSNRYRRKNYKRKKNTTTNFSEFEMIMNEQIEVTEAKSEELGYEKHTIINSILKVINGNSKIFTDLIEFRTIGISKNNAYVELFSLMKLILKDVKLLEESEFFSNNNDKTYDGNYRFYQYRRVQKILLKK